MYGFTASVDVRQYQQSERHPAIVNAFSNLKRGEMMELINDCDPRVMEIPAHFVWEYIEQGPKMWRVIIEKR